MTIERGDNLYEIEMTLLRTPGIGPGERYKKIINTILGRLKGIYNAGYKPAKKLYSEEPGVDAKVLFKAKGLPDIMVWQSDLTENELLLADILAGANGLEIDSYF